MLYYLLLYISNKEKKIVIQYNCNKYIIKINKNIWQSISTRPN